jgi:hypothetical protein
MARHYAPAINFQSFVFLAVLPAFKHNVFIFVTDKQVYPANNGKAYKVKLLLVSEFIFSAHRS